jgi:hypothetical protein
MIKVEEDITNPVKHIAIYIRIRKIKRRILYLQFCAVGSICTYEDSSWTGASRIDKRGPE